MLQATGAAIIEDLASQGGIAAVIDHEGVIVWLSEDWATFARENGGDDALRRFGVGVRYVDGIGGPLRGFYQSLFQNVSITGEPVALRYECSSPEVFRAFHMRVTPMREGGLVIEHSLVITRLHDRRPIDELESSYLNDRGGLVQCGHCRRVRHPPTKEWHWVPRWVRLCPPSTSHGVCATCAGFYFGSL